MRRDLQTLIRGLQNIRRATILTHNIDYLFFASLPLNALRDIGDPSILIVADADCALAAYQQQGCLQTELGSRYRVLPARAHPGYRFHPKAVLLSGKDDDHLFVGSGNLTYGGWRGNGEVWVRLDRSVTGDATFASFSSYLQSLTPLIVNRAPYVSWLRELGSFDAEVTASATFLARPGRESLLEQVANALRDVEVTRFIAAAPYFDDSADAAYALMNQFRGANREVWVPFRASTLTEDGANRLREVATVRTYSYGTTADGRDGRFMHAKFIAAEHKAGVRLFLGSANLSVAALSFAGARGNAELLSTLDISAAEFSDFCSNLSFSDEGPEFCTTCEEQGNLPETRLIITAASWSAAQITITADVPGSISGLTMLVDGCPMAVDATNGTIRERWEVPPSRVQLAGWIEGQECLSQPHWVDNEEELGRTGAHREMGNTLMDGARRRSTTLDSWTRLLTQLIGDIDEAPTPRKEGGSGRKDPRVLDFEIRDAFRTHYEFETLRDHSNASDRREIGLFGLLLRLFGIEAPHSNESSALLAEEDGDFPDVQQLSATLAATEKQPSQALLKRAPKLIESIVERIASLKYATSRAPQAVGRDLAIVGLLMRHAYRQGWINERFFFDRTALVWSTYFLQHSPDANVGLFESVLGDGDVREENERLLASPEFVGALLGWASAVDRSRSDPETLRFRCAVWLAIGRYARIWTQTSLEKALLFACDVIRDESGGDDDPLPTVIEIWQESLAFGVGLVALESFLKQTRPDPTQGSQDLTEYPAGTIAWQGEAFGLCVTLEKCVRSSTANVSVLSLSRMRPAATVRAAYLSPVHILLSAEAQVHLSALPEPRQAALLRLLGYCNPH